MIALDYGRARVLARREDVPDLQAYLNPSMVKRAGLCERRIAGTRSLPALVLQLPDEKCRTFG
jgi:hypothetical protein